MYFGHSDGLTSLCLPSAVHRLLEDQGGAEEAAAHRRGVPAPRRTQEGALHPKRGLRPRVPELGEGSPTLHELVQQDLTQRFPLHDPVRILTMVFFLNFRQYFLFEMKTINKLRKHEIL